MVIASLRTHGRHLGVGKQTHKLVLPPRLSVSRTEEEHERLSVVCKI